jgi:hypothetical protein
MLMRPARSTLRPTVRLSEHGVPLDRSIRIDDLGGGPRHELEAPDRWDVPDPLVLPLEVVVGDPSVERCLRVLDRSGPPPREKLGAHRLVQPLDLASGGRRVRGGEDMADAVSQADPVERHGGRLVGEPAGEDLAVEFLTGVKPLRRP